MVGQTPYSDSDYGFSLPHLLGVAGLLAGMGMFFLIPSPSPPELADHPALKSSPAKAKAKPQSPKIANSSRETLGDTAHRVPRISPAVAERPLKPVKPLSPPIAAVAAKPPVQADGVAFSEKAVPELLSEQDLESYLSNRVPTVGLDFEQAKSAVLQVRAAGMTATESSRGPLELVLASLDESTLNSLPFVDKANCELEEFKARALGQYSRHLHDKIATIDRRSGIGLRSSASFSDTLSQIVKRDSDLVKALEDEREYQKPESLPALVQILEAEPPQVRQQLVELLAKQPTAESTRALTRRAVFDLSQKVRVYAIQALSHRSANEYRPELLEALRYPWSPVAQHAAEALVAINDKKAVPDLISLLEDPDPTAPFRDDSGKLAVRELVRLNHAQNCLLCHAHSRKESALALGAVPVPGEPTRPAYYGGHRSSRDVFVRADVTYLRQDFSLMHDVMGRQRFDYLVRTRPATAAEIAAWEKATEEKRLDYPQRKAVLHALRKLTGKDAGNRSEDWQALLD